MSSKTKVSIEDLLLAAERLELSDDTKSVAEYLRNLVKRRQNHKDNYNPATDKVFDVYNKW